MSSIRTLLRTIITCSGIGDFIFLAQKLVNQPEKFNWIFPASTPRRAFQLAPILPQLIHSVDHREKLGYRRIKSFSHSGNWINATEQEFYLEANKHLEEGNRIEEFLPDLETNFLLQFHTTKEQKLDADLLMNENKTYIGIYTSAYSMSRHWGFWGLDEWFRMIKLLQEKYPNCKFVFFRANYDVELTDELLKKLDPEDYIELVDQPLGLVIEVMRKLELFVSFPSGLPIIYEAAGGKQTIMFFPLHLKNMMNTFADPERIKSGKFKGCQFCPPEQIYEWIKSEL